MDVSVPDREPPLPLHTRLGALTDPLRCRMLLLLENHELMVGEICSILQIPQSTASRHLRMLSRDHWVSSRRDGTSHLYTRAAGAAAGTAPRLWQLVRQSVLETPAASQDALRLEQVLAGRRSRSQRFFASSAHRWDLLRRELFGRRFSDLALLGLLDPDWVVGDLGCGTGEVSAALSPFVGRMVAVDESPEMLRAAEKRLARLPGTELRRGALERLPVRDRGLDAAILMLVLHHLPDPSRALGEAARAVRPGGRLLVVDMCPHDRDDYRQQMGHVWLGFSAEAIQGLLGGAGFEEIRYHPLPPEAEARGPALFTATARRGTIDGAGMKAPSENEEHRPRSRARIAGDRTLRRSKDR